VIKFKKQIVISFVAISPFKVPRTKSIWSYKQRFAKYIYTDRS